MDFKKLFLIVITLSLSMGIFSRTNEQPDDRIVTFLFVPGNDMFYIPWKGNGESLEKLYSLIDEYRTGIESGQIPVYVEGYCASVSNPSEALQLAKIRSNRVKSELIIRKGLKEEHFNTTNHTTAYQGNRDIVVVTLRLPVKEEDSTPVPESEPRPGPKPAPQPVREPEPIVEIQPATELKPKNIPTGMAIRTNLLYDALLTPSLGMEWRVNPHFGIKVDGSFAYWGNEHRRVQKMWLVNPEVRWYLMDAKAFYLGLGATIGEANVYRGLAKVISENTGYQGNFYGGGITAGYQLPLHRNFLLDFNAGLGYTRFEYDTFILSNGYRVYKGRDLTKNFWGPTQAGISLVWLIK